ncbi:WXG100 family type VII secretion target [Saccharopolyspora sp. CA-218241]|uniref:WXG100 family type VII secretion target n=1 Tax=Saccharopolyspora sp. CA-218241 TaxID=3240027 RepID=UPI003D98EC07
MSDYGVNFSAAMAASADLNAISGTVRSRLDSLIADVDKSTADWTGDAKAHYSEAKLLWSQQTDQMRTALQQAQQILNQIIDRYQQTERSNSSVWQG